MKRMKISWRKPSSTYPEAWESRTLVGRSGITLAV
jgi:hypothetical protein